MTFRNAVTALTSVEQPQKRMTRLLVLLLAVILILTSAAVLTRTSRLSPDAQLMDEAAALTRRAFDVLLAKKQADGILIDGSDLTSSGVIGGHALTAITTTDGSLAAKRVSTNPNFAALFVSYLRRAGVGEGDQVGLMFSSSFPALNIACLAACEAVGANVCLMNSVGASVYGATDVDFTFMDMLEVLLEEDVLHTRISLVSFGGEGDVGRDFQDEDGVWIAGTRDAETIRTALRERAEAYGIPFLYEEDHDKNVASRVSLLSGALPHMKLFISVGGSVCALGRGINAYVDTGYQAPSPFAVHRLNAYDSVPPSWGLLQYFHAAGLPVVSMLNVQKLAADAHMDAAEEAFYPIGVGDMYTETRIGLWYPVSVILLFVLSLFRLVPLAAAIRKEKQKHGTLCADLRPGARKRRMFRHNK